MVAADNPDGANAVERGPGRLHLHSRYLRDVDYRLDRDGGTFTPATIADLGKTYHLERMDGRRVRVTVRRLVGSAVADFVNQRQEPDLTQQEPSAAVASRSPRRSAGRAEAIDSSTPSPSQPVTETIPSSTGQAPVMACRYRLERAVCDVEVFVEGTITLVFKAVGTVGSETETGAISQSPLVAVAHSADMAVECLLLNVEAQYGRRIAGPEPVPEAGSRCGLR